MPLHVGTVIVGGFLPKKEAAAEELGGQPASSATDPNFPLESKTSPGAFRSYLTCESVIILCLKIYYVRTYKHCMEL
jgi:hypothetical protein